MKSKESYQEDYVTIELYELLVTCQEELHSEDNEGNCSTVGQRIQENCSYITLGSGLYSEYRVLVRDSGSVSLY